MAETMPLYEVFVRARRGLEHRHAGSLRAQDAEMALQYAREIYTRRREGVSLWVVRSGDIVASQEEDAPAFFDPADDKPYRQATWYKLPEGVRNL
ncbi:MAG: 1,2-phenylacetyl-CoA epoxidase subunit B [Gammaproteobacteria bacterium]|nr:1,2-phenylacetyl-CoA epoxidase subunit B [Gammaproteobacteria bacterium]